MTSKVRRISLLAREATLAIARGEDVRITCDALLAKLTLPAFDLLEASVDLSAGEDGTTQVSVRIRDWVVGVGETVTRISPAREP